MGEGRFAEAASIYRSLVEAVPDNAGLRVNLGMALHMSGQHDRAVPELERALELQPGIVPALLFLGACHLRLRQPAKAIGPLRELVRASPDMVEARRLLGDALVAAGRPDQAVEHYRRWSVLDRSSPGAWFSLGSTYELVAQQAFDALEDKYPESAHMLALVGEVRLSQRQYASAFYLYRQALARRPGFPGAHAALAEIYRLTGHPDWAELEATKESALPELDCATKPAACAYGQGRYLAAFSLVAGGGDAEALYWRARSANMLAKQAFDELAKLPPSLALHRLLAQVHRNQGRHLEAIKHWRAALALAPGDPDLERELGLSLGQARDYQAALPLFERLIRQDSSSAELNFLLGDTLLNLQRAEEAIPYLEKAARAQPDFVAARSALGRALVQAGRGAAAVSHLEAAVASDADGSLHFQLARAYQMSGQAELAREALAKSQQLREAAAAERKRLAEEMQITAP